MIDVYYQKWKLDVKKYQMYNINTKIPVIDLFAGPGGLGEGFSAYSSDKGERIFRIALSIEKDYYAHKTLTLRSFFRQFEQGKVPSAYYEYLRNSDESEGVRRLELFHKFPEESQKAEREALHAELGNDDPKMIKERISEALGNSKEFVLIGGPPCQAYSIIGRARNLGNPEYEAEKDKRQKLYIEYLQILADHHPAVFVMENVKGLLSATVKNIRIFERILEDLESPCKAILREGRDISSKRRRTRYCLFPLVDYSSRNRYVDLRKYIIRMERHGIPQARHRIIILGVRSDLLFHSFQIINEIEERVSVRDVIIDLPEVRSGITRVEDTFENWKNGIIEIEKYSFMKNRSTCVDDEVVCLIRFFIERLGQKILSRGGEFLKTQSIPLCNKEWYYDSRMKGVCNHSTKMHMKEDLHRYLFASAFARIHERSPYLNDFPEELLPKHRNVKQKSKNMKFADRFHVQTENNPSTTVTSHLSKDGHYYIHPDPSQCRSVTVREAARLQTFPDNYFFCGSKTSQYIQVGNAVPPLLAKMIAGTVFDILNKNGLI